MKFPQISGHDFGLFLKDLWLGICSNSCNVYPRCSCFSFDDFEYNSSVPVFKKYNFIGGFEKKATTKNAFLALCVVYKHK